jgi:uncharacterized protein
MEVKTSRARRTFNVIVEPTADCNLGCAYCYKGAQKSNFVLGMEVLRQMAIGALRYAADHDFACEFIWHGGEPTLAGSSYFRDAFRIIEDLSGDVTVSHSLQTNGTLLTPELLDVLATAHVQLGIGLDSAQPSYHDQSRPSVDRQSSHARIVSGLRSARSKGIDVGVLMSITEANAHMVEEMFNFCRQEGVRLGLNPSVPT